MKKFKVVTFVSLVVSAAAVIAVAYNLSCMYRSEKMRTMQTVRECAVNADLLEIISRMKSGEEADGAFVRLNHIVEQHQQKEGRVMQADSVQTSLSSLLRVGLEFEDGRNGTDYAVLDSIFTEELHRHGLYPAEARIFRYESPEAQQGRWWRTDVTLGGLGKPDYEACVSPLSGDVLARMRGIVIPLAVAFVAFGFLCVYLIRYVGKMRTIEQMKEDFTHNMTHELKTPVAVAYSAADSMIRYYDPTDETRNRKMLGIILERLDFLSGMIERILSMSMERFKTLNLRIEPVELKPLVERIISMMEIKATKPVTFDIVIPDGLKISADALHLGNMITNLIDNAIKYSGEEVRIGIVADAHALRVTDNGLGIDRKDLPHIFDKFYRVNTGDRYEVGGYGLGLFYVKNLSERFGWRVEVKSTPGSGTEFIIKWK